MTSLTENQLLKIISDYIIIQSRILSVFFSEYPNSLSGEYLFENCPRKGKIMVDGSKWSFRRHGAGISFDNLSSGVEVSAHVHPDDPNHIDAWRLKLYMESLNPNTSVDQDTVKALLRSLSEMNKGLEKKRSGDYVFLKK